MIKKRPLFDGQEKGKKRPCLGTRENTSEALILTSVRRTCLCLKLVGRLNGRNTGQYVAAARMAAPELV